MHIDIPAEAAIIRIPELENRSRIDAMVLARYFNDPQVIPQLAELIKPHLGNAERVGLPAVLGLDPSTSIIRTLESLLERRVFEIPGLPPSIPGIRLHRILVEAIQNNGGQVFQGMEVIKVQTTSDGRRISAVFTEAAARPLAHTAENFVLATGGILGGGISTNHQGAIYDSIFHLPLQAPSNSADWVKLDFMDRNGHPIFATGILTDESFRSDFENLVVVGGALPGDFIRERSIEGVALVSGVLVGEVLA